MKTFVEIKFDNSKHNEYYLYNGKKKIFEFGLPLSDFISVNIKERYNNIIESSSNIDKDLKSLFETRDTFICNLFYGAEYKRLIQDSSLNRKEKERKINILLDDIANKQLTFSTIIDFSFLYNVDKHKYNRMIDKFIFVCNKLNYPIRQPIYTYSALNIDVKDVINIKGVDFEILDKEYLDFKINNRVLNHYDEIASYSCENIDEFFAICMITIYNEKYIISKCQNCNKYFVPYRKNDAIYCDRISPQKDNKTCKEYASKRPKGVLELYRKIYMKKFARVNRNKDNFTYKNDFETWKETAEKLKSDYKKGIVSDETFEKWLIDSDK